MENRKLLKISPMRAPYGLVREETAVKVRWHTCRRWCNKQSHLKLKTVIDNGSYIFGFNSLKVNRSRYRCDQRAPPPPAYYQAWGKWMEPQSAPTDASAKVFNYLLNVDLSDFDPTTSPYMTPAELDLIDRSDADYV